MKYLAKRSMLSGLVFILSLVKLFPRSQKDQIQEKGPGLDELKAKQEPFILAKI